MFKAEIHFSDRDLSQRHSRRSVTDSAAQFHSVASSLLIAIFTGNMAADSNLSFSNRGFSFLDGVFCCVRVMPAHTDITSFLK